VALRICLFVYLFLLACLFFFEFDERASRCWLVVGVMLFGTDSSVPHPIPTDHATYWKPVDVYAGGFKKSHAAKKKSLSLSLSPSGFYFE
jgi:hypothetical protein